MAHRETDRHRQAFEVWWESERSSAEVQRRFSVSERTAANWVEWFSWHARADARDAAVRAKLDRDAVARRVKMQERHRQLGANLTIRAGSYFAKHEITNARDAVSAAKAGVDIERTAEGLPTDILALMTADADTLDSEIDALLRRRQAAACDPPEDPGDEDGCDPGCLGAAEDAGSDGAPAPTA